MKLRAISGIRTGPIRTTPDIGLGNDGDAISRTSFAPVPQIAPLSRRDAYQMMNVGLSAWQHRLKPSRRRTINQPKPVGLEAVVGALALADNSLMISTPSSRRSIPARKTVMQLRLLLARIPRKSGRARGQSGLDHDTLPGTDNDRHNDNFSSHDVPALTGPIDAVIATSRSASTLRYRLLSSTDDAVRQQVERNIRR